MKKFYLIVAIILMSFISYAQLGLGIKGAFNMSTLSPDISDWENAAKSGFQFGGFLRIGDKWHLQPEVYFTGKGGEMTYSYKYTDPSNNITSNVDVDQTFTINAVDIPFLIGVKILDPPTLNVRLQAGPVASFVTKKTYEVSENGVEIPEDESSIPPSSLKDMNWGLQMGAGVDFLFLTVDVRYELGLNNMLNTDDISNVSVSELKNNVFFVSLGWKIL